MSRAIYLFLSLLPLLTTITARSLPVLSNNTLARVEAPASDGTTSLPGSTTTTSTSTFCGSRGMAKCASTHTCIADPANLATSLIGGAPGLCVQVDGQSCSSTDENGCPTGQTCVDKPGDSCKPNIGTDGLPISDSSQWRTDCPSVCVFLDGTSAAAS